MMDENNRLGEKFRKLRKTKKISIFNVSKGITSRSSLQRWENGEGEMSVEKVFKLLRRIHIQPQEYIDILETSSFDLYIAEIEVAYRSNNVEQLKKLSMTLLKEHTNDPRNIEMLFACAIACNFYFDLSNVDLFPASERVRLESYFSSIKSWTRENVIYFSNVQLYLSSEEVYELAQSLYSYLTEKSENGKFYIMSINALINAVFALIKKGTTEEATNILNRLQRFDLSIVYSSAEIRIAFMKKLLDCISAKDSKSMLAFINNLKNIGLQKEAENYAITFSQIRKLYNF